MLLCTITLVSLGMVLPGRVPHTITVPATIPASTTPTGTEFNHIVIIAMENQNYGSVIGSSNAPFINSLAALGTTISNYHSYGQNINGCSAGCYEAFTSGQQSHSDGWCPSASSPCSTIPNIADQLHTAGLTSAMFCEDGCPRGADHFPWIAYTSTWNSCVTGIFTCNGQTGPDGNHLYGSSSSNGNSAFINYLNSASPANYIWFTPTDNHNMHNNSVSSGDAYLQNLLVGTGTLIAPSLGSVLSTSLFKSPGTFLYIWWDEYDPSPNVEYGSMIKIGHTSTSGYDEYNSLHMIEQNWGLPYITTVVSNDASISDIFFTFSASPSELDWVYSIHGFDSQSSTLSISQSGTYQLSYSYTYTCSYTGGPYCSPTSSPPNWSSQPSSIQGSATLTLTPNAGCKSNAGTLYCNTLVTMNVTINGLVAARTTLLISVCKGSCPQ